MPAAGKFTELTFVNGGAPAINDTNLNELERVVELCDNEFYRSSDVQFNKLKNYFWQRNCKLLENFDDYTDWTIVDAATTSTADDTTNQIMGKSALKITELDNVAGFCSIYKNLPSTIDLTIFNDGSASGVDDCICIIFYNSDVAKIINIQVRIGDDFGNCYYFSVSAPTMVTGWNAIYPQKSDFTTIGAPGGWNSIDYIRVAPNAAAGSINAYVLMQSIQLIRQDPVYSGYANPFQKYMGSVTGWVNVFVCTSDLNFLYQDESNNVSRLGHMKIPAANSEQDLFIYADCINFISRWEFICKYAGETASVIWRIDANNYAELYISGNTFYLKVNEGGAATTTSVALTNNLLKDERVEFYFEKNVDTFRGILYKKGENYKILEYETTIATDSDGDIYLGESGSNSYSILTDFTISNGMKDLILENEYAPQIIKKRAAQIVNNSNVLVNDTHLLAYLNPYSIYEFIVNIAVTGDIVANFKCGYVLGGSAEQLCARLTCGATPVEGYVTYETPIQNIFRDLTNTLNYGTDGTYGTCIVEKFMIKTGASGGTVQLQWAQDTADVSDTTVWDHGTWMKVQKVKML